MDVVIKASKIRRTIEFLQRVEKDNRMAAKINRLVSDAVIYSDDNPVPNLAEIER